MYLRWSIPRLQCGRVRQRNMVFGWCAPFPLVLVLVVVLVVDRFCRPLRGLSGLWGRSFPRAYARGYRLSPFGLRKRQRQAFRARETSYRRCRRFTGTIITCRTSVAGDVRVCVCAHGRMPHPEPGKADRAPLRRGAPCFLALRRSCEHPYKILQGISCLSASNLVEYGCRY